MARPVTLFTGQWADLPFEEVARLAGEWGYDGLEIACWGDHFDPWAAVEDDAYVRGPPRDPGQVRAAGLRDLQPPHRPGRLRRPDRRAAPGILPARVWGDGEPEGVRQRAAEAMKVTARAAADARRGHGRRVHRVEDLEDRGDVPAGAAVHGRRRLPRLRRPLEPDPRRVRRGRRPVRARGAPQRDRLRLLDDGRGAGGRRAPGGVRAELGPEPLRVAGPRPGRVPVGLPRPDLPRRLQGREAPGRQRPQRPDGLAPGLGRPAARLGLRLHRPRRRAVGGVLPDAQHHRLRRPDLHRVGGRRDGPAGRRAGGAGVRAADWRSTRRRRRSTPPSAAAA